MAISPTNAQNWGGDRLGHGVTIPAGGSHIVKIATGTYDVLVIYCAQDAADTTSHDITIAGNTSYKVSDSS